MENNNFLMIQKTFLEKWDLFIIMFFFYLIGIYFSDIIPIVIPLKYPVLKEKLFLIVFVGFLSYLLGKRSRKIIKIKNKYFNKSRYFKIDTQKIKLIILLFVFICFFYYWNGGFPLLASGEESSKLKLSLTSGRTYGATRILYTILPYVSILLFSIAKNNINYGKKNIKYFFYIFLTFSLLLIGLFKGSIISFFLTLVFVNDKYYRPIIISFRNIFLLIFFIALLVIPIFLTEINEYGPALLYLINRLIIHSWEGLNFIVSNDLPSDLTSQLSSFAGLDYADSPDVILGAEFTGINPPPIAIVPTLFGFCYRNGGFPTLIIIFYTLGFIVSGLIKDFALTKNELKSTTYIFLYIILFKMMLVGNVFNDIRGPILSVIVIHYFLKIILNKKTTHD